MSATVRRRLFVLAGIGLALFLLWGMHGLPPFGDYRGPYGLILNRVAVPQRHVTDVVSAVNFDYRGFDTIEEEFILFTAVTGVALLLRVERQEQEEQEDQEDQEEHGQEQEQHPDGTEHPMQKRSEAIRALCLLGVAPVLLFGLYIVTHGQLTPGGGFQGGTILASALVLLYLAGEYDTLRAITPTRAAEIADAVGAAGFVAVGVAGLIAGAAFLRNIIPLGPSGKVDSAGTIPVINLSVGLEVAGGFLVILSEFLEQLHRIRARKQP